MDQKALELSTDKRGSGGMTFRTGIVTECFGDVLAEFEELGDLYEMFIS
jgi:hypothetical protein